MNKVIIINGASCSGKTTIAKEICKQSNNNFVHLQIDKTGEFYSTIFPKGFLSLFSLPFAIFDWKNPENLLEIFLLTFIGIIFLFNSLALFLAIKHADLTTLMPIDFSGMIFTAILSYLVFGEIIKINTLIGSIIVFVSSLYLIYQESKKAKDFSKISEGNIQKE